MRNAEKVLHIGQVAEALITRHLHKKKVVSIIQELYPISYFNTDHYDWYVNKLKKEGKL